MSDIALKRSPSPTKQSETRKDSDVSAQELPDFEEVLTPDLSLERLSLYEKKSLLINRELDRMGMGRYQWCIFFLCGFGYFLDLCWAQAFGLVAAPLEQELGVSPKNIGKIFTAFSAGLTVGAFGWGLAVDIIGRRWCFNLTCLIASIFGLIFAAPSNFGAICFITSMIGLGIGGNIPIDATITLEFLPNNKRYLLAMLSTFQPVGVVVCSGIAYGLVPTYSCGEALPSCSTGQTPCCRKQDNMGWRYLMLTLGCMTLAVFLLRFVIFKFQESPKFLLSRGCDADAIRVINHIAAFNRTPPPQLTLEDFLALDKAAVTASGDSLPQATPVSGSEPRSSTVQAAKNVVSGAFKRNTQHLKGFFKTRTMAWLTITMWIAYMSLFWSFSIAGGFLPLILKAKGVNASLSVADTYRSYVYIYLPGIVATLLAGGMMDVPYVGRKWAMVLSAGLMAASLFLYAVVNSVAASIGFNAMEYFFQSMYAALLYAYTPEAFPGPIRGTACGVASTLGRIAGTVAPLAANTLYYGSANPGSPGVLYLAGGAAFVSMIAIALLPFDTKGRQTF